MSKESPKNGECGGRSDLVEMSVDEMLAARSPSEAIREAAYATLQGSDCQACPARTRCNSTHLLGVVTGIKHMLETLADISRDVSPSEDALFQVDENVDRSLTAVVDSLRPSIRAMEELCRELHQTIQE